MRLAVGSLSAAADSPSKLGWSNKRQAAVIQRDIM